MQARNCRERVLNLKKWRMENGKTIAECIELCGDFPSEKTVEKVFLKGSEEKSFRESTIAAIELACLGKVYSPEIKIPVEDVIRAQEETAKRFADENRLLRQTVEKQAHIIDALLKIGIACLVFFGGIALYDYFTHSTGFWNTDSYPIWIAKVAFLLCLFGLLLWFFIRLRAIKARFAAEEAEISEAKL